MAKRFDIGDEVRLDGIVRLLDAAGPGTVTIELRSTGQRVTIMADSSFVELKANAKPETLRKSPKGGQDKLIPN